MVNCPVSGCGRAKGRASGAAHRGNRPRWPGEVAGKRARAYALARQDGDAARSHRAAQKPAAPATPARSKPHCAGGCHGRSWRRPNPWIPGCPPSAWPRAPGSREPRDDTEKSWPATPTQTPRRTGISPALATGNGSVAPSWQSAWVVFLPSVRALSLDGVLLPERSPACSHTRPDTPGLGRLRAVR
jgi:hypothetical protein